MEKHGQCIGNIYGHTYGQFMNNLWEHLCEIGGKIMDLLCCCLNMYGNIMDSLWNKYGNSGL